MTRVPITVTKTQHRPRTAGRAADHGSLGALWAAKPIGPQVSSAKGAESRSQWSADSEAPPTVTVRGTVTAADRMPAVGQRLEIIINSILLADQQSVCISSPSYYLAVSIIFVRRTFKWLADRPPCSTRLPASLRLTMA